MNQPTHQTDYIGIILVGSLLLALLYAGFISYQSIDWDVLKRLESQSLVLPLPASSSATVTPH